MPLNKNDALLRKAFMALTGLFLVLFLIGHLAGNLKLLLPNLADDARLQFNAYAHFMTTNPLIKGLSYATYLSVIVHVVLSIALTVRNRRARPVPYKRNTQVRSRWSSRNMGILGTFILIFLVIHMRSFWYEMHWGVLGTDQAGNKDLYQLVITSYQSLWYVLLYVVSMVLLGFHLVHGFWSAFQTLGLYRRPYATVIRGVGTGFAILMSFLFAIIPIVLYARYVLGLQ